MPAHTLGRRAGNCLPPKVRRHVQPQLDDDRLVGGQQLSAARQSNQREVEASMRVARRETVAAPGGIAQRAQGKLDRSEVEFLGPPGTGQRQGQTLQRVPNGEQVIEVATRVRRDPGASARNVFDQSLLDQQPQSLRQRCTTDLEPVGSAAPRRAARRARAPRTGSPLEAVPRQACTRLGGRSVSVAGRSSSTTALPPRPGLRCCTKYDLRGSDGAAPGAATRLTRDPPGFLVGWHVETLFRALTLVALTSPHDMTRIAVGKHAAARGWPAWW